MARRPLAPLTTAPPVDKAGAEVVGEVGVEVGAAGVEEETSPTSVVGAAVDDEPEDVGPADDDVVTLDADVDVVGDVDDEGPLPVPWKASIPR